jgi:hypothetical protein
VALHLRSRLREGSSLLPPEAVAAATAAGEGAGSSAGRASDAAAGTGAAAAGEEQPSPPATISMAGSSPPRVNLDADVETASATADAELDYAKMLNGVLPDEIRVLGWVGPLCCLGSCCSSCPLHVCCLRRRPAPTDRQRQVMCLHPSRHAVLTSLRRLKTCRLTSRRIAPDGPRASLACGACTTTTSSPILLWTWAPCARRRQPLLESTTSGRSARWISSTSHVSGAAPRWLVGVSRHGARVSRHGARVSRHGARSPLEAERRCGRLQPRH